MANRGRHKKQNNFTITLKQFVNNNKEIKCGCLMSKGHLVDLVYYPKIENWSYNTLLNYMICLSNINANYDSLYIDGYYFDLKKLRNESRKT